MNRLFPHSSAFGKSSSRALARLSFVLSLFFLTALFNFSFGQSSTSIAGGIETAGGFEWKSRSTIQQILQQELIQTNNELASPGVTDWSTAMLEAYRSLITFAQAEMLEAISKIPEQDFNASHQYKCKIVL